MSKRTIKIANNMSMVFRFRMVSDESDVFLRDYEVMYDMPLSDFCRFICNDLNYDPKSVYSFFTADSHWRKIQEFTSEDMGHEIEYENAPIPMDKVLLGQLIHNNHDRLIYTFDMFADRSYFLELIGVQEANEQFEYPRVMFAHGEPSDQFDPEMNAEELSIFDEAMGEFNEFDGDDSYDDEY